MTKTKSSVVSDFVLPIGVLLLICIVASALLAYTNSVTAPIIAASEEEAARQARIAVLPEADDFEEIQVDGLPDSITQVLSHEETVGLGSKITGDDFRSQFVGKDASLEGVDIISGATFSSNYYINAIRDAFTAYDLVKEGQ